MCVFIQRREGIQIQRQLHSRNEVSHRSEFVSPEKTEHGESKVHRGFEKSKRDFRSFKCHTSKKSSDKLLYIQAFNLICMFKKLLAFAALLALAGCQSGGTSADVQVKELSVGGCIMELLDEKGGSVMIQSPAQYSNFERELNALGLVNENCESDIELPEIDFASAVFVASNEQATCSIDNLELNTVLEDNVLQVSWDMRELEEDEAICESAVSAAMAVELSDLPEDATILVD